MKRIVRYLRDNKWLSLAILALVVGLVLEFSGQKTAAHWVLGVIAIIEVLPILWGMTQDIRSGKYGIDILAVTAIIASVWLGQYWAAIVVVIMLTGGESLEKFAEHRTHAELDALLKTAPQKAHLIRKNKTLDVAVSELHPGDRIIIKPGEVVPVDAIIIEGVASFDESNLTGESLPQSRSVDEEILSGTLNLDGAITAKAIATADESQYQQIVRLVQSAAASQSPYVRLAERYSIPFTIAAFAIALAVWAISGEAIRFLQVIIVATPCPLLLAAPIALIGGIGRANRYGIIVKSGTALEKLGDVASIAFDKTGTLTSGVLTVDSVKEFGDFTEDQVLATAASVEQYSNHILADAIINGAKGRALKIPKAKHVKEVPGRGLQASINSRPVLVGRFSLLQEHGVLLPKSFKADSINQTAAYVAIDGTLAGVITLKDQVRDNSKDTLKRLHALGVKKILMITGDNQSAANTIAGHLGIDMVHADMLPADKLHNLTKVKERPLAFVGDGVNDAPALTAADIGIALGARGSTAASESADMVIMADDISRVADAVSIAKRTFSIAQQSILIGIGISLGLMLLFATGKFSPLLGAILQEVVDVIVIFNALRAHVGKVT